jgi:nucleoside-diphosphate-sugar epimerase
MKKQVSVAVTGGNGFIGAEVLRELINNNVEAVSLQRTSINKIAVDIHQFDLSNLIDNKMSILSDIDVVVHTAALVHKGQLNEKEYLDLNFESTKLLFEKCKKFGVSKFIFLSTMSVYGLTSSTSKINIKSLVNPITNYGKSKLLSEQYLLSQKSSIKVSIIRLPTVYGNNAPGNFGDLERLALKHIPLPFLNVKNKRSMINVEVVAKVLAKISICREDSLGLHLLCEEIPFSTEFIFKKIRQDNGISLRLFFFPKFLIKFFLKLFGKQKVYERLYEDLVFTSTIKLPHKN